MSAGFKLYPYEDRHYHRERRRLGYGGYADDYGPVPGHYPNIYSGHRHRFDLDHFGPGNIPGIIGGIVGEIGRHAPAHRFDGSRAHGEWDGCRGNGEHVFGDAFDDRCDDDHRPRRYGRREAHPARHAPDDTRRGGRPDARSEGETADAAPASSDTEGPDYGYSARSERTFLGVLVAWAGQFMHYLRSIVDGVYNNQFDSSGPTLVGRLLNALGNLLYEGADSIDQLYADHFSGKAHAAERETHTPGDGRDEPAASPSPATVANRLAACLGDLHDGDGGRNDHEALGCIASIMANTRDLKARAMARAINSQLDGESVVFRTSDSDISDQLQRTQSMIRDFTTDGALDRAEGEAIVDEIEQMNLPDHIVATRSRAR